VQYGISERATEENIGVPMLRMNNLQADGWDLTDLKYIQLGEEDLERYQLQPGDLLFNRTNSKELVGKCEVFSEKGTWVFASYLIRVRLNNEIIPEFISTFLNAPAGRAQIDRVSRHIVGMANVNAVELRDLLIPLPKLIEQQKLMTVVEKARESRNRKQLEAEELLHGLDGWLLEQLGLAPLPEIFSKELSLTYAVKLREISGRLDAYSNQPRFRKLQQLLLEKCDATSLNLLAGAGEIFTGSTPKVGSSSYTDTRNGVPFIRSGELGDDGEVSDKQEIFITEETHNGSLNRSQLRSNDVLIAIVGATIGAVAVYKKTGPANINQAIAGVRLNSNRVLPEYLCWFLKSWAGQEQLRFLARPVARANINLEEIGRLLIPTPKIEVQQKIVAEVHRRKLVAKTMRDDAAKEWAATKMWFGEELLGKPKPD
jgi:restriction endonuclease S subunit